MERGPDCSTVVAVIQIWCMAKNENEKCFEGRGANQVANGGGGMGSFGGSAMVIGDFSTESSWDKTI